MSGDNREANAQLALNTVLEASFVSPLSAIRGALENLRDYPDMAEAERLRFVTMALDDCQRLEQGISHLSETVYADHDHDHEQSEVTRELESPFADRIAADPLTNILEIDFSDFVFKSSSAVNEFFDSIDKLIEASGHLWYVLVNYRHCSVWPEAWVAFAHRGQKVNQSYSMGTVHYIEAEGDDWRNSFGVDDPETFHSKTEALARINQIKQNRKTT